MILLAGFLYDLTGSYTIPFAITGAFLFPAAIASFSIKGGKYSARFQVVPATAASAGD